MIYKDSKELIVNGFICAIMLIVFLALFVETFLSKLPTQPPRRVYESQPLSWSNVSRDERGACDYLNHYSWSRSASSILTISIRVPSDNCPPGMIMTMYVNASCACRVPPTSYQCVFNLFNHVANSASTWLWSPRPKLRQRMLGETDRVVTESPL